MSTVIEDNSCKSDLFPMQIDCIKCKSRLEISLDDIDYDSWKISGYHFDGSAVSNFLYTFKCPCCQQDGNGNEIDESLIPIGIQQKLKAKYKEKQDSLYKKK